MPVGKVPHGTTKHTYRLGLNSEARLDRNSFGYKTVSFPRNPTDHISSDPPATTRTFQNLFDRMIQRSKYNGNVPSSNPWSPRVPQISTANNLHSVSYNLISHEPNTRTPSLSYTDRLNKSFQRQKGISEINDLKRSTAENRNVDHRLAMTGNERAFARKDGIFTHLYNSAARFGENKPFKA